MATSSPALRIPTLRERREGSVAVEFGLLAPALFAMLFGVIEAGRLVWTQAGLHFAVEEAARCAAVDISDCATPGQIAVYAAKRATEFNIPAKAFAVTTPACGHQVSVSFPFSFIASGFFPRPPRLTAMACFP